MVSYRYNLDSLRGRRTEWAIVHLIKVMCSVWSHSKIHHVTINKQWWIFSACLNPVRVVIIIPSIGVIRGVAHCVWMFVLVAPFRFFETSRLQAHSHDSNACVRHHNGLRARGFCARFARAYLATRAHLNAQETCWTKSHNLWGSYVRNLKPFSAKCWK